MSCEMFQSKEEYQQYIIDTQRAEIEELKAEIESDKAKIEICAETIKRQDKEIERLEHQLETLCLTLKLAKAEARKETLETLEKRISVFLLHENAGARYTQGFADALVYVDEQIDKVKHIMLGE